MAPSLWQCTGRQATQTKVPWELVAKHEKDTSEHIAACCLQALPKQSCTRQVATDGSNKFPLGQLVAKHDGLRIGCTYAVQTARKGNLYLRAIFAGMFDFLVVFGYDAKLDLITCLIFCFGVIVILVFVDFSFFLYVIVCLFVFIC